MTTPDDTTGKRANDMSEMEPNIDPEFRRKFNKERCPICNSIEGCDHTMWERLRALTDFAYRDQMRAEDPLSPPHDRS